VNLVDQTVAWLTNPAHWSGANGIPIRLLEHLLLSGSAFAIAVAIALPIGLAVGHTGRGASVAVNLANLGRAVPTLATIGIVAPLTQAFDPALGFTVYPTLIGLIVLALPPVLVNAYSGIAGVDSDLIEAARGMGMRERQILTGVEVPLSLPVILAGLRLAAVTIVSTANLGAIFGFGGLGRYLVDGIAQNDFGQLFGGVVLAAGLTLLTEGGFALLQRAAESPGLRRPAADENRQPDALPPGPGAPAVTPPA
jgi:osmoprotectant transport system permease protein